MIHALFFIYGRAKASSPFVISLQK